METQSTCKENFNSDNSTNKKVIELELFVPKNEEELKRSNEMMAQWRVSRGLPPQPPETLEQYSDR